MVTVEHCTSLIEILISCCRAAAAAGGASSVQIPPQPEERDVWVSAELRVKAGLNDMLLDGAINTFQVLCNFTVMGFFIPF